MDRAYVEKLLANAKKRSTIVVHLPSCGQDLELYTSLNQDQQLRVAAAGGADEDAEARMVVGILRFVLVHEGELLLRTFEESSGFFNSLDPEDMGVIFEKLIEIGAAPPEEQAEAGKAS